MGAALTVLLATGASAWAQDQRTFDRRYSRGEWALAARAAALWAQLEPGNAVAAYNAACAEALAGRPKVALVWLRRAGAAGFAGTRSVDEDPDLAQARGLDGFEDAVATIRTNRMKMFTEFRARAERATVLTILPPEVAETMESRPLIVALHGSGGEPESIAGAYREAAVARGAILAAPAALRPGPGGSGYSWTYRDEAEWWVLRATERLIAELPVDPERVILAGFSQGANVALAVGLAHPDRFAGVLAIAGHHEPQQMAVAPGAAPRVYLLTGSEDPSAPTYERAASELRTQGLEVALRIIPGLGHRFPPRPAGTLGKALDFLLPAR